MVSAPGYEPRDPRLDSQMVPWMSEEEEYDSDMDYSDNDCGYADYYNVADDCDVEIVDPSKMDVEYFVFECLTVEEVERLLNESVESLSNSVQVIYYSKAFNLIIIIANGSSRLLVVYVSIVQITPSLAKVLLHSHKWCVQDIVLKYRGDSASLLVVSKIKPSRPPAPQTSTHHACDVCMLSHEADNCCGLACGHLFCNLCWSMHFEVQIAQGISTGIACMAQNCEVLAPEDFVLNLLSRPKLREKYQQFAFCDYVQSHPELRFCPGPNCQVVVRAKEPCAKRVICTACSTVFCSAVPFQCPRCHICIEKNGGCNHMMCFSCKHDFCWMCLGDWKTHGSEYYECSRFKENPNIAQESVLVQAREALKKYLHYYERWENHCKSLKLEEQTLQNIKAHIHKKVMDCSGTWIDWQYLLHAAFLLAKCRYTLQYTYPYAYYMEPGPRKELFEYQQAQLEAEIENLSWKVERAETTHRGELENQMDVAEKRRGTLLKDFLKA
uniref:RBR-type E3 ubiquitin transferase n=1 Tax=Timema bartmani TaxID=61472 RepID=A0A7R9ENQ6_9NEOP|nr:unnamed protein product [Timema bartmani]